MSNTNERARGDTIEIESGAHKGLVIIFNECMLF